MIITVTQADYLNDYRLHLQFNTGESGEVDLRDIIFKYKAALPLRNMEDFQAFTLDEWSTVVWKCGFDVSPETLYEQATGKHLRWLGSVPNSTMPGIVCRFSALRCSNTNAVCSATVL